MLKFVALALALAAPVVIAAPAHAADVKTLSCVEKGLDQTARANLMRDLEKNLNNAGSGQSYSPETVSALQGAAKACQQKYGWSDKATTAAILYTVPKLGWPLALRMGREKGVRGELLAKRVKALSPEDKADATSQRVLAKLAGASSSAGELNESNALLAGALYGLLTLQEKAYIDFQKN